MTTSGLLPDLTIILMVDPKVGLSRISVKEFGQPDRLEKESVDFHTRVYQGYKKLVEEYSRVRNITTIDTTLLDQENTFNIYYCEGLWRTPLFDT